MDYTHICGCILAGGQGTRLGGIDKGQLKLNDRSLVEHVYARFRPQVDQIIVSANRNLTEYAELDAEIRTDEVHGFAGPLAGMHSAMHGLKHDWLATVPCDSPFLPHDLVRRLYAAAATGSNRIAVARCAGRVHPVFNLVHRELADSLTAFLHAGERKIMAWFSSFEVSFVDFEDERAFLNINTSADLSLATAGADTSDAH